MKNISIKYGLAVSLALMLIMIALLGALGLQSSRQGVTNLTDLSTLSAGQANAANRAEVNLMEMWVRLARYGEFLRDGQDSEAEQAIERARQSLELADRRFEEFSSYDIDEAQARYPHVVAIRDSYTALVTDELRNALSSGDPIDLMTQRQHLNASFHELTDAVRSFIDFGDTRADQMLSQGQRDGQRLTVTAIGLLFIALVLFIAVQLGISRLLVKPLSHAITLCEHIAKGDLTHPIENRGRNEVGRLYTAMQGMQDNLRKIIGTLSDSSTAVASSAGQIASGSEDLASRTEQQASALQQTASSMEEMSSIVRHNSDTSGKAESLTDEAATRATTSRDEVNRTAELMRELEQSSRKVHEIIEVIDSIAFQTNILALNASVEAARAGEHGRGFAVVASEVRQLASRTSDSSKEIRDLVEDISNRIADGAEQAMRSGDGMQATMQSIEQVTAMMKEIALSAKEQESGIGQVSTAITQMDSATQQNVSLVEETSTAASSLQQEAQRLADLVASFRLDQAAMRHITGEPGDQRPDAAQAALASPARMRQPIPSSVTKRRDSSATEPEWETF